MSAYGADAQRQRLAAELRRARVQSGISGRELARRAEVNQSIVSRVETGEQKTVPADLIVRWCKAAGAPDEQLTALLALNEEIQVGPRSWEEASETGSTNLVAETAELESRTGLLLNYQPAAVPGLLQTAAYARRLLSSGPFGVPADLAERVMGRTDRQRVLYRDDAEFRFVVPEAVLRWPYGPPGDPAVLDEHREQLGRLLTVMDRPNVRLAILPLSPVAVWRLSGFVIFDQVTGGDPVVHLEWLTRPYSIVDLAQVDMWRHAFSNLLEASVEGEQARNLIAAAATAL